MNALKSLCTENLGLKLLSILLAFVVWMVVSSGVTTEIAVTVPLEFRNVPAGARFTAIPSDVQVRVRGSRRLVRGAAADEFTVPVDYAPFSSPGEHWVVLTPDQVEAPASFRVVQVAPSHIRLTVEAP